MPFDLKYGRVTLEKGGHIGDDEPVVVFRAKDRTLPALLAAYRDLCAASGSPGTHLANIRVAREAVLEWQRNNSDKVPD